MREIKFRAWNNFSKRFIDLADFVINPLNGAAIEIEYDEIGHEIGSIILEQYTGLKDKNGVYIYEGDIVKVKSDLYKDFIGVVGFWSFNLSFSIFKKRKKFDLPTPLLKSDVDNTSYEVIGNIHENSYLLEEQ